MDTMDELLDSLLAPSFFYDLSADAAEGTGVLAGLDDSFFDVEHPLHESSWPTEPPRALVLGSPGGVASSHEASLVSAHVSPVRGSGPAPATATNTGARLVESPQRNTIAAGAPSAATVRSRPPPVRTQKRSTGAAGLQTPVERQVERALRGRRFESPGAIKHRAASGKASVAAPIPLLGYTSAVDEDSETRNLLAELEMHNKKVVEAGRLAAKERVKLAGGGLVPTAAVRKLSTAGHACSARATRTVRPSSTSSMTGRDCHRSRSIGVPHMTPTSHSTPEDETPPQPTESPKSAETASIEEVIEEKRVDPPQPSISSHSPQLAVQGVMATDVLQNVDEPMDESVHEEKTNAEQGFSTVHDTHTPPPPPPPPIVDPFSASSAALGTSSARPTSSSDLSATPPAEFVCPITRSLMKDPVSTIDGQVFERAAIERWFRRHQTNPLTGKPVESTVLVPNLPLASLIAAYLANVGGGETSVVPFAPASNKAVQFSEESGIATSGATTRGRRNGGSSTGGGGLVGATGGTGRPRSTGSAATEHTPTASTRPSPVASGFPLQHTDFLEPPESHYFDDKDEVCAKNKLDMSVRAPVDPKSTTLVVLEDRPVTNSCASAVVTAEMERSKGGKLALSNEEHHSGKVPVAHVRLDSKTSGVSKAVQSRREELEAWRRERDAKRERERHERAGGRAASSALRVLEQHNARINKKSVANAQQRLKAYKATSVKPAAGPHFCSASDAIAKESASRAGDLGTDPQLLELLERHNAKVGVEPLKRVHESHKASVAAMRAWEARTGRTYASLSYDERAAANNEILAWHGQQQTTTA